MEQLARAFDELAARRAAEIDEIIEDVASFAGECPVKLDVMFESLLLSYAAMRSRRVERCTVLLGKAAYDRAKSSGLLAWCAEAYPNLTFEPPSTSFRGPQANLVILDETAEMP